MIRSKQFVNGTGSKGASRYFTEELSASDYYARGVGQLGGKELWRLGLEGRDVDQKVFEALEKNLHPVTGEQLTPRMNEDRAVLDPKTGKPLLDVDGKPIREPNRRTGRDICFVVPKTVSEYIAFNPGERAGAVERMIYASWRETMDELEALAQVRERKGGAQEDRTTGNLIYFSVVHRDARPEGKAPDPYFHIHTYCFNLTWDHEENRWKAAQMAEVVKRLDAHDAFFLARLEARLRAAGFGTERTPDGRSFELTGVSKEAKALFSKRHARIVLEERQRQEQLERMAGAIVRDALKKGKALDFEKVLDEQRNRFAHASANRKVNLSAKEKLQMLREQMTPAMLASLSHESVTSAPSKDWRPFEEAKREVVAELFKNRSVAHELDVAAALVRAAGGGEIETGPAGGNRRIQEALDFARSGAFVRLDGAGNLTTPFIRQEERRMRRITRLGWDRHEALAADPKREIQDPLVAAAPDQQSAVCYLWQSRDLVMDVSGIAGAGKTTLLKEAVPAIREKRQVILLAPTSSSVLKLRKAFSGADTLQNFQLRTDLQDAAAGAVIVLDEASLVSVPQMAGLVAYVEKNGCRLILCGDSDQHHAVERGDALRILEASGAVRPVQLTETYRAKDPVLKAAVLSWKAGRREEAYDALEASGAVREVLEPEEMRRQAVEAHLEAIRAGKTSILGSPLHVEAREVARIVSDRLLAEGLIGAEAHPVTRLDRIDLAEGRSDPIHYQEGNAVCFRTRVEGGFRTGETWTVKERLDGGRCVLERSGGITRTFDSSSRGKWDVYQPQAMELRAGQQVRITQGYRDGVDVFKTNDLAKVKEVTQDRIVLEDGRSLPRAGAHLDQGTCITSHAAQCMTVDQCVPLLPMRSFSQVNAKSFYVYFSRARHKVVAFTDCKEALKEQVIERRGDRPSVWEHELQPPESKQQERARDQAKERVETDLQAGAIKTPAPAFPVEQKMSAYERGLWKRAAAKYPVESRTPDQQEKIARKIRAMVRRHEAAQTMHHSPAPPARQPEHGRGRGHGMGM